MKKNYLPYIKPDANLEKIVGPETLQTHLFLKALWKYINEHNLKIKAV